MFNRLPKPFNLYLLKKDFPITEVLQHPSTSESTPGAAKGVEVEFRAEITSPRQKAKAGKRGRTIEKPPVLDRAERAAKRARRYAGLDAGLSRKSKAT